MFGFLRKKTRKDSQPSAKGIKADNTANDDLAKDSEDVLRQEVLDIALDVEDLNLLMKAYFRSGDFAGLCFAKAFDFDADLSEPNGRYQFANILISAAPTEASDEGKRRCFEHFDKEVMRVLSSNIMALSFGFRDAGRKPPMTSSEMERISDIGNFVRDRSISKLSNLISLPDMENIIYDYVCWVREQDIEMIAHEFWERKHSVRKIFGPLRNTRTNKYGDEDFEPEFDEIEEFLDYLFSKNDFRFFYTVRPLSIALSIVDTVLDEGFLSGEVPEDGIEFEHWCADRIRAQGWDVSVSKASGDQGVDIVAARDRKRVAVQCKRYTNPIGNKAVQEAFTGAQNVDASV